MIAMCKNKRTATEAINFRAVLTNPARKEQGVATSQPKCATARRQSSCKFCGTIFKVHGKNPGIYCSRACKGEWQRTQKPVTAEWLRQKYVVEGLDCTAIAKLVGRNSKRVWEWLQDLGIPTRKRGEVDNGHQHRKGQPSTFLGRKHTPETRAKLRAIAIADGRVPYDRAVGPPLKGKRGAEVPSWKGGVTPERQAFYSTPEWRAAVKAIWKRDNATCQRCGKHNSPGQRFAFDIHHIVSFAVVELRAEISNLILLCEPCHYWVHSNENTKNEYIGAEPCC